MHLIEKNENCAFNGHFLKTKQNIDDKHWIQHITNKAWLQVCIWKCWSILKKEVFHKV